MGPNTKYKDSVFSFLFSEPELLRELYCALGGYALPADVPIAINTLRDVLFMGMVNDISFEIDGKLIVLIEHQSTINPNMAIRFLMYISRVYEKTMDNKNIYSSRLVPIPKPEFYVLYNGTAPYPEQQTLKLSDAYEKAEFSGMTDNDSPSLELIVKVININFGINNTLINKCKTLAGYSAFVAKVREFEKETKDKLEAMKKAVKYCCENDILKEFLEKHGTEVMSMLSTEWNLSDAQKVWFEEGLEEGREEGREDEREAIARNALMEGASIEFIKKITGLDTETIKNIVPQQ
jgi:predicted transposase/invertase (TIGR01784 family)